MKRLKNFFRKYGFEIIYFFVVLAITLGIDWLKYHIDPMVLVGLLKLCLALTAGLILGYIKGHWFN